MTASDVRDASDANGAATADPTLEPHEVTFERFCARAQWVGEYGDATLIQRPEVPTTWAPQLSEELPPTPWTSRDLTIAPGRPTVLAGEGGTRKGWLAMAMQVCGAAGVKLFGRIGFRAGLRSVYLDYEQGRRESTRRYQALATGYGIPLASLGRSLGYRWRPIATLAPKQDVDRQRIIDALCWNAEGFDLVIIDSVRRSSPGIDENSVFASIALDIATDASERTGAAFVFLDHAGKPRDDQATGRTRKHAQRGHSSKLDAAQTLLVFSSAKGEPTLVTCERSQTVAETEWPRDLCFSVAAAEHGGLYLREEIDRRTTQKPSARFDTAQGDVLALLAERSDLTTKTAVYACTGGNKQIVMAAIGQLIETGRIVQPRGPGTPFLLSAVPAVPAGSDDDPEPVPSVVPRAPLKGQRNRGTTRRNQRIGSKAVPPSEGKG